MEVFQSLVNNKVRFKAAYLLIDNWFPLLRQLNTATRILCSFFIFLQTEGERDNNGSD